MLVLPCLASGSETFQSSLIYDLDRRQLVRSLDFPRIETMCSRILRSCFPFDHQIPQTTSQMLSDIASLINQIIHTKDLEALSKSISSNELREAMHIAFTRLSIATANREHERQACKEQEIEVDGCMTEVPQLDGLLGLREDMMDDMSDEDVRKCLEELVRNVIDLLTDAERLRLEREQRGRASP